VSIIALLHCRLTANSPYKWLCCPMTIQSWSVERFAFWIPVQVWIREGPSTTHGEAVTHVRLRKSNRKITRKVPNTIHVQNTARRVTNTINVS
jgi:hypothetical protein